MSTRVRKTSRDLQAEARREQLLDCAVEVFQKKDASAGIKDIAAAATRRALSETVGQECLSLFGSSADDLAAAFRQHARLQGFGDMARRFSRPVNTPRTIRS